MIERMRFINLYLFKTHDRTGSTTKSGTNLSGYDEGNGFYKVVCHLVGPSDLAILSIKCSSW